MQSNAGFLEGIKRQVLTVNSTSNTAFSTFTDLLALNASFNPKQIGVATAASARGRVIDLGLPTFAPYTESPGGSPNVIPNATTDEASQGRVSSQQNVILAPTVYHASAPSGKTGTMQVFGLYPLCKTLTRPNEYWALEPLIEIGFTGSALPVDDPLAPTNYWSSDVSVSANTDNCIYQLLDGSAWATYPVASGQIAISTNGARYLYLRFLIGTATSVNCFWRNA